MTTRPEEQFVARLRSPRVRESEGVGGGSRGRDGGDRVRGRSAVGQYFLSSHGQLADRLTRPLLAQHTNLASGVVHLAIVRTRTCMRRV